MSYHKTKRKVATASAAQVRRPIYSDSVQLWKHYEAQLAPLYKVLLEDKNSHEQSAQGILGQSSVPQMLQVAMQHHQAGELLEAETIYRQVLALDSDNVNANHLLGVVALEAGKYDAAIQLIQKAVKIYPNFAEAHNNLGMAYRKAGHLDASIASFREAISINPDFADAYTNLGASLVEMGQLNEAIACYNKAISINPDFAEPYSSKLTAAQYDLAYSSAETFEDHLAFAEQFEVPLRSSWPLYENGHGPQRRLNVGFVSGDLHQHPVGYFLEGVLTHLNQHSMNVVLYPTNSKPDALTQRLKNMGFVWNSLVGQSDDIAAQRIRDDGIDILVDLSGHTTHNRLQLFARKPAPIQISWLGYFSTTGLQAMDYILCDQYVIPDNESNYFVEEPWRMPDSYLCFTPPLDDISVESLPALRNGYITFGCFNNLLKMGGSVVTLWAQVLQAVPKSRLFLKSRQLNDTSMQQATLARFTAHGIESERLMFEGSSPRLELLASYNRVDVALDPFPFPGGTTTVESLWMGVPVLNLQGDRFLSHVGESILNTTGLPEWVAKDTSDYVSKAVSFTRDLECLAELRSVLRPQLIASPLCNAPLFARNLEAAFRGMWEAYCNQTKVSIL